MILFLRYKAQQTEYFAILDHDLHFNCHPDNLGNQNLEKLEKTPGYIIILHMCTINDNHMMYVFLEIWSVTDRMFCNFGWFFILLPP